VTANLTEALHWSRLAAAQGHSGGQVSLGLMYARGEGVTQDGREAVRWFRAAAKQGDPRGELNLAMAHWMGLGIPRDVIEAYLWASLSAAKGNEEGKELQAAIRQEMTPSQIAKAQRLAKVFKAYTPSSLPQSKPKRSWSASH
jgi:uncharacterized protein